MLLFTEFALNVADGQLIAAISTALTIAEAAADFGAAVQAPTLIPSLVFVAFGIQDIREVVPLSSPPKGE
jgi:hypothetical protein